MKNLLLVVAVLFTVSLNAQITKDSLISKMSKEACEEIAKKDLSKMDKNNIEQEMGMLLMPTLMANMSTIEKVYGIKMTDQAGMQKMGYDLGMNLAMTCPDFMKFSMELAKDEKVLSKIKDNKASKIDPPKMENEEYTELKGTLLTFNSGDISTLSVKESNGKTTKLYWMEYFENADNFRDNMKKYLGKKIVANYMEREVYNAATKSYKTVRVITSIELQ